MKELDEQVIVTVFASTGKVGREVLKYLSDAGVHCRAITRDISKAKELPFVEWVKGDINNKNEIASLLSGTQKIFLNSGVSENMVEIQNNIIDAAQEIGINHIIKLSTPSARADAKDSVGAWHWQIQKSLEESGIDWNVLQPQSFMQNWLGDFAKTIRSERKIYSSAGEGKRAFIDTRDIGKVAARLFTSSSDNINQIIQLSGAQLVSYYQFADAISDAIGEQVTYISQTPGESSVRLRNNGVPDFLVNITLAIDNNQRIGMGEKMLTNNVKLITEDIPFSIHDFAAFYSKAFK
ncbi:NmrA family NAD(P)-binding protein [Pedobacter sp. ISL-68]|uniref:NmrA family NAD(P)-binding protein n=1 Tax=unclassified Pedobacter TaxID=2628915 RepID=UPI001BE5E645|nr:MULTISPECIES: NmrA family NAD(P)-binding protein [unclassified Pedobacter]MBT2564680.1 NmrA family NAD(P)-binding protein [Pedobacter sp. ISL-64]MBT2592431.1 NmrA family NAD(P)-binding protein [Pedobacter sp. ISL-68]